MYMARPPCRQPPWVDGQHSTGHPAVIVPVSCRVRDGFDRQVCVNVPPLAQAVEASGVQPPGQMQIELVVSVPVAGWVREELLRQVWVNAVPSQTVAGSAPQPPVHVQAALVSVPVAGWVRAGLP